MIWFMLAICFLLTAILAAIKRGPVAAVEPTPEQKADQKAATESHVAIVGVILAVIAAGYWALTTLDKIPPQ